MKDYNDVLKRLAIERRGRSFGSPSDQEIAVQQLADMAEKYIPAMVAELQELRTLHPTPLAPAAAPVAAEAHLTDAQLTGVGEAVALAFKNIGNAPRSAVVLAAGRTALKALRAALPPAPATGAAEAAGEASQNPLIAFLLTSDTGVSSKSIAARHAGVAPHYGYYGYPYDSVDFGRCYRLLQLVPAINIAVMRGASATWDKLVDAWPQLTAAYEQGGDYEAFRAIIRPITTAPPATPAAQEAR